MAKKTSKQLLDESLAQQKAGTYVDPMIEARENAGRMERGEDILSMIDKDVKMRNAGSVSQDKRSGFRRLADRAIAAVKDQPALRIGRAVAPAAAMASGPVGAVAGGALALEGLYNAMGPQGEALDGGMALLGAIPGARMAKGAIQARRSSQVADSVGDVLKSTKTAGSTRGVDDVPQRPASGKATRVSYSDVPSPSPLLGLNTVAKSAGAAVEDVAKPAGYTPSSKLAKLDEVGDDYEYLAGPPRPLGQPDVPADLDDAAYSAYQSGAVPAHLKALDELHEVRMGRIAQRPRPQARPADDFVHPEDTTGGEFGFDELPEISERELAAMQRRWSQFGVK